jgi:ubiquitin carboxyl-terminal hydrolase 25
LILTHYEVVEQEIKEIQGMVATQFVDSRHLAYRLYAVFMHQGSVEFGHYYIYIYDFGHDVWRKYNDAQVMEVQNRAEIFDNEQRLNPPTPYFLVYVNDSMKDRLVDPVCREIIDILPALVPYEPQSMTDIDTSTTIDGVPTMTMSDDVNMDPPPYEEWANRGPTGMNADSSLENPGAGIDSNVDFAQGEWPRNYDADRDDVKW